MPPQEVLVCAKPSTARRVAGVLRSRGYAVETAGDGERAVAKAERDNPAVVLIWSDLRGPAPTDVIRRVRNGSAARVGAIVRRPATGETSALLEAGADAVLLDAKNLDHLARTVDRHLDGERGFVDEALAQALTEDEPFEDDGGEAEDLLVGEPPSQNGHEAGDRPSVAPSLFPEPPAELEAGIDFQDCDVAEIVHEGAAEAARGYPSVLVQVSAPPRLPAVAEVAALRAAVRLLVEDACRNSEPGSDVTVKAQRVDAGIFVLVADRGAGPDREQAASSNGGEASEGPISGFNLARALVALHGGILSAEPIPAGGNRASFAIPERPPILSGVELQGALRALELLDQAEAAREPQLTAEPASEEEDDGHLLEQAIDLAAAVADAAALAPAPSPERTEAPETTMDPVRSLAELFGFEPDHDELAGLDVAETLEPVAQDVADPPDASLDTLEESPADEEEVPPEDDLTAEEAVLAEDDLTAEEAVLAEDDLTAEEAVLVEDDLMVEEEVSEVEPISIPEPVPAAEGSSTDPAPPASGRVMPAKSFVPDPLHPATAILRALAEEYDAESNRFRGR